LNVGDEYFIKDNQAIQLYNTVIVHG